MTQSMRTDACYVVVLGSKYLLHVLVQYGTVLLTKVLSGRVARCVADIFSLDTEVPVCTEDGCAPITYHVHAPIASFAAKTQRGGDWIFRVINGDKLTDPKLTPLSTIWRAVD
jgi:hypothetical protein